MIRNFLMVVCLLTAASAHAGPEADKLVGLGTQLTIVGGQPMIIGVFRRSAAERAKLRVGDRIVSIDGKPTQDAALIDIVNQIKGPKGTKFKLSILPEGDTTPREIELTRREFSVGKFRRSDLKTLERLAEEGRVWAQYALGNRYFQGHSVPEDHKKAVSWFKKAAESGHLSAQMNLAGALLAGKGIKKDLSEAARLLELGAQRDNHWAISNLGVLYYKGEGVVQNYARAIELYRRAAALGYSWACFTLGGIYETGEAAEKDLVKAYSWYLLAAAKGYKDAAPRLKKLKPLMTRKQIEKAQKLAATEPGKTFKTVVKKPAALPPPNKPNYRLRENPDDFALVVGIGDYSDLPDARFAERDAEAVKNHMLALGIPRRNIIHLAGSKAGFSALKKYLEAWLPRNVKPESRVYFYFSGHGAPDIKTGEAYLIPWDGDPSFLNETAYPLKRLYRNLSRLKAKEIIVALDACFSGAGGRSVLAKGARPLITKIDMAEDPGGTITSLTAASGNQITTTIEEQGHGIFTYFFLKGLNGAAKDPRGRVTAKSLYDYLKPKVQDEARRQNREQTPTMHTESNLILRPN